MQKLILKYLCFGLKQKGGRNNQGRITSPRRKAICKRTYRFLDFRRRLLPGIPAKILKNIYDPNRSGNISLILYPNGVLSYILCTNISQEMMKKNTIVNLKKGITKKNLNHSCFLRFIPLGTTIFNLALLPGFSGQYIRGAGVKGMLLRNDHKNYSLIKLKSGEHRLISNKAIACVGQVSNGAHFLIN